MMDFRLPRLINRRVPRNFGPFSWGLLLGLSTSAWMKIVTTKRWIVVINSIDLSIYPVPHRRENSWDVPVMVDIFIVVNSDTNMDS